MKRANEYFNQDFHQPSLDGHDLPTVASPEELLMLEEELDDFDEEEALDYLRSRSLTA